MPTDRLQGLNIGTAWKPPCYVASTTNLTLSSTQVVDGIAVGSCERVLAKDQTDPKLNGVYIADAASWRRAPDWDGSRDAIPGTAVYVDRGSAGGGKAYIANSSATATSIDIASTGDDVTFSLMTLALAGVSAFSQDTLLPLATQAAWRSTDGLNVRGATATMASSDIAANAITLPKWAVGSAGALIVYSSTGVAEEIAPGTTGHVLTANGASTAPTFQAISTASTAAAGVIEIGTSAEVFTGTDLDRAVVPGTAGFHQSAAQVWVNFNGTGTVAIREDYNVSSITDNGTGDYTINIDVDLTTANYSVAGSVIYPTVTNDTVSIGIKQGTTPVVGSFNIVVDERATGEVDVSFVMVIVFGGLA